MCDTLYKSFESGERVFAKNSDRDPLEPQVIELASPALPTHKQYFTPLCEQYFKLNMKSLEKAFFDISPVYQAIISRPTWIWGAEMGVNERGVAIGNEAVFSLRPLEKEGLLGMDMLRLALHNASTAQEATEIITYLLEKYGQGGNCAYRGKLTYHNSFLVSDPNEAYVLETAGKNYAIKKIERFYSISNIYTIDRDFDKSSPAGSFSFKGRYEADIYKLFTKGHIRRNYTMQELEKLSNALDIRHILRSHIKSQKSRRSMASVCMHSPRMIKSETTSSMIVHYRNGRLLIWVTFSPNPCVALYKPLTFSFARRSALLSAPKNLEFFGQRRKAARLLLNNKEIKNQFTSWQKEYEDSCLKKTRNFTDMEDRQLDEIIDYCWKQEQEIINRVVQN